MDSNIMAFLEEFMESALVTWLFDGVVDREDNVMLYNQYMDVNYKSQNSHDRYLRLTNGIFLNEVMRIIDPNPKLEHLYRSGRDDQILRVQNFSILNRHLRAFYQDDLQQLILMPLPNTAILGQDPLTEAALEELRRLLLLLLGCAIQQQCERKETFIQQIQTLDIETQTAIANCIQEVTQDPRAVLPLQWEELGGLEEVELQVLFGSMARQIQGLLAQRDTHLERIAELCLTSEVQQAESLMAPPGGHTEELPQSLAVQLADSRAKLRFLRQELEDKGDQLLDYKQEVQTMEEQLKKLQKENRSLQGEVRGMRALRDELDCLRDRAGRAEQLHTELQSCTHRLRSLEVTRTQLKEQQQLCVALQETRVLLEEQLADTRQRCSSLRELERDNLLLRQRLIDLEGEQDTERQRVDELLEMNMGLEAELRQVLRHNNNNTGTMTAARHFHQSEVESDEEAGLREELREDIDLKPLSVEVGEASSLRLLGAENENAELRRRLEDLQSEQEVRGQRQADLPEVREELACLEAEHQNTLREFQNVKNENATLKKSLELLLTKHQSIEEEGEKGEKEERGDNEERGERGVQGSESSRGEGEGTARRGLDSERGANIIRTQREAGVGAELLHPEEIEVQVEDQVLKPKKREEEGEKEIGRERDIKHVKNDKEEDLGKADINQKEIEDPYPATEEEKLPKTKYEEKEKSVEKKSVDKDVCVFPGPDVERLASELQHALEQADRQASVAQDLHSKLVEQSRKAWEAEQRLVLLEAEGQRLRKATESLAEAKRQIEVLQAEGLQMEEELCRLRSQVELQLMQASVIATLEGERATLERERETLRSSVDTLRTAQRKGDQLELTTQALRAELEHQERSLESSRRNEEELEAELRELALEVESLTRGRNQALLEASRLEQEKEACQGELDSQRKEQRQREREAARLRQQLQSTASALEHSNQRACSLETGHRHVCQELSQSKELCAQLQDLEKELGTRLQGLENESQELKELNTEAQNKIRSLTQELANEKVQSQELSNEAARLKQEFERVEAELKTVSAHLLLSEKWERDAVSANFPPESPANIRKATSSDRLTLEHPEAKDAQPKEGHDLCMTSDARVEKMDWSMSERLIDLERENAAVGAEREVLLSQLSQSQAASSHLREQINTLQHHSISLQETCTKLQTLNTQLQVEQASLSFQHAAALARCSVSEARCAALEAESKVWAREHEESLVRTEGLRRDQERMTALQQRQEAELEELLDKHSYLRSSNRNLETQHKDLEGRYQELLGFKSKMEETKREMKMEREKMEGEVQKQVERERELERLKEDNERLQGVQREWAQVQSDLLAQGSVLRGELSAAQLERTRLEGEISSLRENNQRLELSTDRLTNQYQLLTQLKGNMEEENRHLLEQNQSLTNQNRDLMEQSLECKDQHHSQQREYQEKMGELRREKQKLVEKIMDQYRVLDPCMLTPSKAKKSNWIADRMKKLIKPKGGGGREGRAPVYAAGSIENLADSADYPPNTQTAAGTDPRSAPVSPSPLRRAPSLGISDQTEGLCGLPLRSGSGCRRKLGSRRKLASQSFSPGDQKTSPLRRLQSADRGSTVIWEGQSSPRDKLTPKTTPMASATTSQENVMEEEGRAVSGDNNEGHLNSDPCCQSSKD
ncbi:protein Daple isoform X3 [Salmo salar]|uniref:Protein Daple isoform X3 n=1 Tax=Salmo salar TaxID=8030 RepID=A0ABM3F9W4_SALSA|nr:protein Daple-like isoform X3 [Salmo salar]